MSNKQKDVCWGLFCFAVCGLMAEAYLGVKMHIYIRELRNINTVLISLFFLYSGASILVNRAKIKTRPYH